MAALKGGTKACPACGSPMKVSMSRCPACESRKFAEEKAEGLGTGVSVESKRVCSCSNPEIHFDGTCSICRKIMRTDNTGSFMLARNIELQAAVDSQASKSINKTPVVQEIAYVPDGALQEIVSMSAFYVGGIGTNLTKAKTGVLTVSNYGFRFQSKREDWHKNLKDLKAIQIGGSGSFQTGGGWVGGGFGVTKALEGAAFAGIMNALTTKTKYDCLIRIVYPDVDISLQILDRTPRQLEIDLTGINHYLGKRENEVNAGGDNIDRLIKLADLVEKGLISKDEFEAQKGKLI